MCLVTQVLRQTIGRNAVLKMGGKIANPFYLRIFKAMQRTRLHESDSKSAKFAWKRYASRVAKARNTSRLERDIAVLCAVVVSENVRDTEFRDDLQAACPTSVEALIEYIETEHPDDFKKIGRSTNQWARRVQAAIQPYR